MLIYIVEDDADILAMEIYALRNSGFEALGFSCGSDFFAQMQKTLPSLVILDVMLPHDDGLSILKKMRAAGAAVNIPVMMVTAKSSELDKVVGLDYGADDYLTKPFGVLELVSRVKALLRRAERADAPKLCCGIISMDDARRVVTSGENVCELTFKEYELLKLLLLNQGIALSRETIMNRVWGFDFAGESRTVDVHVKTLRQKLFAGGEQIKTVRNIGYKMEAQI